MNPLTVELSKDLSGGLRDHAAKVGLTEEAVVLAQLQIAHRE